MCICVVPKCEHSLKYVTVLQTDAQGVGKAGGTIWLSLVLLPTLVVLSSESLRSSFICLPSGGCYRDGVVHVRCRTRGPQGEEVKAVLVAFGVGGDLKRPGLLVLVRCVEEG
jgi:hypothetical protein